MKPAAPSAPTPSCSLYVPVDCEIVAVTELTPQEKLFRVRLPEGRPHASVKLRGKS